MTEKTEKRIFCDVPVAIANRFLAEAKIAGTSGQALLSGFIERSVSGGVPPQPAPRFSKDEQKWIDKLLYVLRSGDAGAIRAVCSNLDVFERTVKLSERLAEPVEHRKKRA